jgi:SAM-dependent methyltransferase
MTRPFVGTIVPEDYGEIVEGVQTVKRATKYFQDHSANIAIQHEHRFWEYGSAVQALLSMYGERMPELKVLDVGSGYGALGPTLALTYNTQVTECEPEAESRVSRRQVNQILRQANKNQINVGPENLDTLPDTEFDAVFCISVLEHVPEEGKAWSQLAKRVKKNGLLFITTDCVPAKGKKYQLDFARNHNFTPLDLKERVEQVQTLGFATMGKPDYAWHGPQVFDYTFFRAGLIRLGA